MHVLAAEYDFHLSVWLLVQPECIGDFAWLRRKCGLPICQVSKFQRTSAEGGRLKWQSCTTASRSQRVAASCVWVQCIRGSSAASSNFAWLHAFKTAQLQQLERSFDGVVASSFKYRAFPCIDPCVNGQTLYGWCHKCTPSPWIKHFS